MSKTKYSCEEFIDAIKGTNGVKKVIAEKLGVSRMTVHRYLERWVTAQEAYEQEAKNVSDMARSILIENMRLHRQKQEEGKVPVPSSEAKWWLTMKESDEFNEKQRTEITGEGGQPLTFHVVYEDAE